MEKEKKIKEKKIEEKEERIEQEDIMKEREELERRCRELEEYAKRLKARFENYKREVAQEKQMIIKNANEYLINKLIPILDDFERALKNAQPSESFIEGVRSIYRKLVKVLENEGLSVIEPQGKFDPFEHEAFEKIETDDHEEYSVLEVVEKGYKYHGKVVKPAKVKVAVKPSQKEGEDRP